MHGIFYDLRELITVGQSSFAGILLHDITCNGEEDSFILFFHSIIWSFFLLHFVICSWYIALAIFSCSTYGIFSSVDLFLHSLPSRPDISPLERSGWFLLISFLRCLQKKRNAEGLRLGADGSCVTQGWCDFLSMSTLVRRIPRSNSLLCSYCTTVHTFIFLFFFFIWTRTYVN